VTAVAAGTRQLRVTLIAGRAGVPLTQLSFRAATNATVIAGTQSGPGGFTVTLPAGTTQYSFQVVQQTPGQAATVPLTVTDACGDWPTFVGGGPEAFTAGGQNPAPAPTVTVTPRPGGQPAPLALAPTATTTPTPAAICTPRPAITVATTPSGAGRLQVTVRAPEAARDSLQSLRFGSVTNATIDVGSQAGLTGNTSVPLPPGTQQATFTITRVAADQASTVTLVVVDSCGEWPTVVGLGPGGF
jgi:hypothetical protein